jgi:hypothetical protein
MTYTLTCDRCGETIDHDDPGVTLDAHYNAAAIREEDVRSGWVAHYHLDCWTEVYDALRNEMGRDRLPRGRAIRARIEAKDRERKEVWARRPIRDREHLLLNILGEDRLTVLELTERVRDELGDGAPYEPAIRNVIRRLYNDGELKRVGERRARGDHAGAIRYRYFKRALSGAIADLDRAFHER